MQITYSHLRLTLKWMSLALALGACFGVQAQQNWPSRPIRMLVPYPSGGGTDTLVRVLGQKLSESLGQPVVVENRGGANGGVGTMYFIKSAPDNHFFMVPSVSLLSINQHLYREIAYDPDADLKSIGLIAQTPNLIVTSPALQVHTLKGLVEYGKAHPNKLSFASAGVGSTGHLLNALFKANAGINLLHVPYKGNGPAMMALLAGEVQFMTDNVVVFLPHIRAGKLRPLAVTSPKRFFKLPEVPTVVEAGFPNLAMGSWWGLVAQTTTQPEVIARMNRELVAILQKPDFIAWLGQSSLEALPGTPEEMTARARKDRESWKKMVEISGAKAD